MTNKDIFKGSTYSSLEEQVGGKHYRNMKIQPAEFINENKLLLIEKNIPLSSNFSCTFMTSYCRVICTFLQNTMLIAACSILIMKMRTIYSNFTLYLSVINCDLFLTYLWQTRNKNLVYNEYDRPDYSWFFVMVKGQKYVIFHFQW